MSDVGVVLRRCTAAVAVSVRWTNLSGNRQHDDRPLERCWGLGGEAAHEPDAAARERLAIDSSSTKWVRKALE